MSDVIAVFPLSHILLPGMGLPLHIFEQRYRDLLRDVTEPGGSRSFGIVGLTRGSEVGAHGTEGEPEFSEVGTVAEIAEIHPYEDGASDLMTVGSRRFRIRRLVPGRAYLQAEVDFLPETDGGATRQLCQVATRLHEQFNRLVVDLTGEDAAPPLAPDPGRLSYQLASWLPLPPADRQALLEEPTDASRLMRTVRLLRRELRLLAATRSIAVAPRVLQLYIRPN